MKRTPVPLSKPQKEKFPKRLGRLFNDRLGFGFPVAWDAEVICTQGAHFHFWVPKRMEKNDEVRESFLQACVSSAKWQGKAVSFSHSYTPDEFDYDPLNQNKGGHHENDIR